MSLRHAARHSSLIAALLLVLLASKPAAAVRIKPSNCLSASSNKPGEHPFLRWDPLAAEAKFDTKNGSHNFQFVAWGNVGGFQYADPFPSPNDTAYWNDANKTNGKIVNSLDGTKATTLSSTIDMLSYTPWSHRENFCEMGLNNGVCPLGPVFNLSGNV